MKYIVRRENQNNYRVELGRADPADGGRFGLTEIGIWFLFLLVDGYPY